MDKLAPVEIKVNKFRWAAILYFFFNSVALPLGLLYTTLLTPFFYVWLLLKKRKNVLSNFVLVLLPFVLIHWYLGVDHWLYLRSLVLLFCSYVFICTFYYIINHYSGLESIYRQLSRINFFLVVLAVIFFFTPWKEYFWYVKNFTTNVADLPRLALFTYEASYYSLLLVPLVYYYLLKLFMGYNRTSVFSIFIFSVLPLFLSLSLGVLAVTAITVLLFFILHFQKIWQRRKFFRAFFWTISLGMAGFAVLWYLFPENVVFTRVSNIFNGLDTSAKGRITYAFSMAREVAEMKSIWFGSGLGQTKILAREILREHYPLMGHLETIRIANAVGETLASFGIMGILVRFFFIAYFFLKTRVWRNYYRLSLFIFVFIYQFTGSFLTNIVEYVIWAIAFSSAFTQFNCTFPALNSHENSLNIQEKSV